jgi:probable addiction module antidote protein
MLTRKDGTPITPDNLTDEDVALTRWNVLEHLDSEEEITGFLEAVIEEGGGERSIRKSLVKAAQARIINQLAKDAGVDRKALCEMFLESNEDAEASKISHDVVVKVARAFAVPVPL